MGDHLTRFFFCFCRGWRKTHSEINNGGNLTVRTFLDNVSFEMRKRLFHNTINFRKYSVNGNLNTVTEHTMRKTVPGGKVVVLVVLKRHLQLTICPTIL